MIIGTVLRVCYFKIEGILNAKSELLGRICSDKDIDVIVIQETHTIDNSDLCRRGHIDSYVLIGEQYGVAIFVKDDIDSARTIHSECSENIEVLTTEVCGITFINTYKLPNVS